MKSVLIIEDHEDSCSVLKALIQFKGFKAECKHTMDEGEKEYAAKKAISTPYDLVVSDLCLPDSTAGDTLRRLKSFDCPVRAISGVTDPTVIAAAAAAGVKLILKSTSPEGILESILYAFMEEQPDPEAAHMIAENRQKAREIPLIPIHSWLARLFASLPQWAQTLATIGAFLGVLGTITSAGAAVYANVYHKGQTTQQAAVEADAVKKSMDWMKTNISSNSTKVRALEDKNISVEGKIDALGTTLDTNKKDLDKQLDRILNRLDNRR